MSTPKVSVIMPLYNAEKFVAETIDSILNQTFTDFEFLVIDDASTDNSFEIVSSYRDTRLKLYKNEINIGYVKTLNKLIDLTKGEYIARQDNDDISHPNRLYRQVNFLEKNLDVGVCGTRINLIGKRRGKANMPVRDEDIRAYMLINTPLLHPTVMIRKSIFDSLKIGKYDESYCPAEDYALWFDISKKTKLANLPHSLLLYREHENNVSLLKQNIQIEQANRTRHKILDYTLSIEMTEKEEYLYELLDKNKDLDLVTLNAIQEWFLKILKANDIKKYYSDNSLGKVLFQFWTVACLRKTKGSIQKRLGIYFFSRIFKTIYFINFILVYGLKKINYITKRTYT